MQYQLEIFFNLLMTPTFGTMIIVGLYIGLIYGQKAAKRF